MLRVALSFVFIIVCMLASAQVTYSIYYEHKVKYFQNNFELVRKTNSRLVFNDSASFYYFITPEQRDKFKKSKAVGDKLIHHGLFYNKNTAKFYHEVTWPKPNNYMTEMKIPYHNWIFTKEEKEILNYKCYNAREANSNGDTLSVWYTTEIKNIFGPMRYFGLPGVVLAIDNYNGGGTIKAISVDTNTVTLATPQKYIDAIRPKE